MSRFATRTATCCAATLVACLASLPAAVAAQSRILPPDDGDRRECLVLGDESVSKLAYALSERGERCDLVSMRGADAAALNAYVPYRRYAVAYVVVGSRDGRNRHLESELRTMRSRILAPKVVWFMPYDRRAARAVDSNAGETGGLVVDFRWWPTLDGVNPVDFSEVARIASN